MQSEISLNCLQKQNIVTCNKHQWKRVMAVAMEPEEGHMVPGLLPRLCHRSESCLQRGVVASITPELRLVDQGPLYKLLCLQTVSDWC